jgi:hypothetical protein
MNNLVYEYKLEHQDDNENAGMLADLGLKNPTMWPQRFPYWYSLPLLVEI